jgi:hypothetical protein
LPQQETISARDHPARTGVYLDWYAFSQHLRRAIHPGFPAAILLPGRSEGLYTDNRHLLLLSHPVFLSTDPAYGRETMTAPSTNQFMTDEYVLAYHGPLIYEARVSRLVSIVPPLRCFCQNLKAMRETDVSERSGE